MLVFVWVLNSCLTSLSFGFCLALLWIQIWILFYFYWVFCCCFYVMTTPATSFSFVIVHFGPVCTRFVFIVICMVTFLLCVLCLVVFLCLSHLCPELAHSRSVFVSPCVSIGCAFALFSFGSSFLLYLHDKPFSPVSTSRRTKLPAGSSGLHTAMQHWWVPEMVRISKGKKKKITWESELYESETTSKPLNQQIKVPTSPTPITCGDYTHLCLVMTVCSASSLDFLLVFLVSNWWHLR